MRILFGVLAAAVPLFLSSCSTLPGVVRKHSPAQAPFRRSMLLLQPRFVSAPKSLQGCALDLKGARDLLHYAAPLSISEKTVLLELPSQDYRIERLECAGVGEWELPELSGLQLAVYPLKINAIGIFEFRFHGENGKAVFARTGTERENATALKEALHELPAVSRLFVASACTGKEITEPMLDLNPAFASSLELRSKLEGAVELQPLRAAIRACTLQEARICPLQLGKFVYRVNYDAGRFLMLDRSFSQHVSDGGYLECLERAFRDFRPDHRSPFEVEATF